MKKSQNKSIRIQILNLQDEHCASCQKVPAYRKSGNRKTSWCADNCRIGKQIKQLGDTLLEGRNETMAEQMAEERNWDALCERAEKLRGEKLSWAKIADRLGVSESTLYHNVAKRREKKESTGISKSTKSLDTGTQVVRKREGKSDKGVCVSTQTELKIELERVKQQLQDREKEYITLLNECNQLSEKKWEVEAELRKTQIRISAAEEAAEMERKHRLECQAKVQALGIALKVVL
ncbi:MULTISPECIES: zinc-finger domain-containing protein [Bacillus cereus group]|uniref:Zinc-finger domain-containing protein n=1 Tax=Bacillus cereus TaxID=1396 RepID=A0AAW5L4E1_BACCE|nr:MULTISPECIES: zinc-finger domain-containing protein [Bacillus cereus group]MCQ6289132.1 zinc-finger domain-containing protein [Bacillus cereus]MCQ6318669.1 zinc-finger domain-containing protein [Bacillus cereus]MCQ6330164.1 zinc-finger domain-containing protein [Bacillus cereus]MCQ6386096.1 zinc-finger domain-containing protein [Bacillus cereus]MDM8364878.1 zinc-finger domain-containing protein [Bacillus thuringiensis]